MRRLRDWLLGRRISPGGKMKVTFYCTHNGVRTPANLSLGYVRFMEGRIEVDQEKAKKMVDDPIFERRVGYGMTLDADEIATVNEMVAANYREGGAEQRQAIAKLYVDGKTPAYKTKTKAKPKGKGDK